jgi:hypothetical protein
LQCRHETIISADHWPGDGDDPETFIVSLCAFTGVPFLPF